MRLSLFSRLTVGYLVIFLIVAFASGYAIVQLGFFRARTEAILKIDNRIIDHGKVLADLVLAQSRAEQKFTITKDEAWYLEFVRLKIDFEERLESAFALNDRAANPVLKQIQNNFHRYDALVDE
ncbi:MAG TPA: hypothetical protein VHV54_25660, partial [Candidatus Binatia bacterium]|nr:hypothetical protein [Candidatus Binatia bacterium]